MRLLHFVTIVCLFIALGCNSDSDDPVVYIVTDVGVTIDAGNVTGTLAPLWRDHYDLSYIHANYGGEAGFTDLANELEIRSFRCSVGRWEIGFPAPLYGNSLVATELAQCIREFYTGGNNLADADNPANYNFIYLDALLAGLDAIGAEPYLCFDYMPFTLASEQDPANANNLGIAETKYSFSNGIRTSPPVDNAVYARVVRNAIRHVRGLFAGTTDYGVTYFEVGNEPDLCDAGGTLVNIFWTGTSLQFGEMYAAIAAEVDADAQLTGIVKIGGGSFAMPYIEPDPPFAAEFVAYVKATTSRLDFFSYHSYNDALEGHVYSMVKATTILDQLGVTAEVVNGEWGRALDGADAVYDTIEHGLFRGKVIAMMQVFGIEIAHESLFRDVGPGSNQLGLVKTGPPSKKPATDVYLALKKLNDCLDALQVAVDSSDHIVIAGNNSGGTKVVAAWFCDDPGYGGVTQANIDITNLPWGMAAFTVRRYLVSDATNAADEGVKLIETQPCSGGAYSETVSVGPGPGAGSVVVWELTCP